jgi:hypothetical protein
MLLLPNGDARKLSKAWSLSGLRRPSHSARTAISADSLPFQFSEADEEPQSDSDSIRWLASELRVGPPRWRTNRPLGPPSTTPGLCCDRSQLRSPRVGVGTLENSSFANLLRSIYRANAGAVRFPARINPGLHFTRQRGGQFGRSLSEVSRSAGDHLNPCSNGTNGTRQLFAEAPLGPARGSQPGTQAGRHALDGQRKGSVETLVPVSQFRRLPAAGSARDAGCRGTSGSGWQQMAVPGQVSPAVSPRATQPTEKS